jgi:hypothetical protein
VRLEARIEKAEEFRFQQEVYKHHKKIVLAQKHELFLEMTKQENERRWRDFKLKCLLLVVKQSILMHEVYRISIGEYLKRKHAREVLERFFLKVHRIMQDKKGKPFRNHLVFDAKL